MQKRHTVLDTNPKTTSQRRRVSLNGLLASLNAGEAANAGASGMAALAPDVAKLQGALVTARAVYEASSDGSLFTWAGCHALHCREVTARKPLRLFRPYRTALARRPCHPALW